MPEGSGAGNGTATSASDAPTTAGCETAGREGVGSVLWAEAGDCWRDGFGWSRAGEARVDGPSPLAPSGPVTTGERGGNVAVASEMGLASACAEDKAVAVAAVVSAAWDSG